jgi:hypothetical protein
MALLYQATLTPSKTELLQAWVPGQPWIGDADVTTVETVGAYRFDDPDGEVGLETHLLQTADGRTLQVPLTYRGSPLIGAEASLVTTMQHSVLGERWVYDACGDPVYVLALATAILSGGRQADLEIATDNGPKRWEATTRVAGSGTPGSVIPPITSISFTDEGTTTVIVAGRLELAVLRVIDSDRDKVLGDDTESLMGTWPGHDTSALLVVARMT